MTDRKVRTSAPGKLILSGEYAVLDGAPAICMAIDRRARVDIAPGTGDKHTVAAPGHSDCVGEFRGIKGDCEWLAGAEIFGLVDQVWRAAEPVSDAPLAIRLDTREFSDPQQGTKLGIGSSAALTVALAAAISEISATSADARSIAYAAHRQLQGGLGSGADIACCSVGGLIEYRMVRAAVRQLAWPAGLHYALLWSGVAASTGDRLRLLDARAITPTRAALGECAQRIAAAWCGGRSATVLGEYRDYIQALQAFSIDQQLGIFDAGHAEVLASAEAAGLVYKPCGAGGGDVGILLGDDPGVIDDFVDHSLPQAFRQLKMSVDPIGVEIDREKH